ncbi:hypothetical protein [Bacillus cereus]|uniref:hypothetical protein n=1 Tax=Bacillus cereus TaxID=1396 RepID=UPI00099551F0
MAKFTADEKIQIVLRYLNGNESYREIGRSLGINGFWCKNSKMVEKGLSNLAILVLILKKGV